MGIQRDVVLAITAACLLAACAYPADVHVGVRQPPVIVAVPSPGPPAHAPAHGYRAKYLYRYYPVEQVYFDPGRQVYFYLDGPYWRVGASLPLQLVDHSHFVVIEMDDDEPYLEFEKHKAMHPKHKGKKKKKKG